MKGPEAQAPSVLRRHSTKASVAEAAKRSGQKGDEEASKGVGSHHSGLSVSSSTASPQKSCPPGTSGCDLIWKQALCM